MKNLMQSLPIVLFIFFGFFGCFMNWGCSRHADTSSQDSIVSPTTRALIQQANSGQVQVTGRAKIGVLYMTEQPAQRASLMKWFADNGADVTFESRKFGYAEAALDWDKLGKLVATAGNLGLDQKSFMKLELDAISAGLGSKNSNATRSNEPTRSQINSSFFGPAHSAGYGARVEEFRIAAAKSLGMKPSEMDGRGTMIAVYDGGVDLSRTDVFGDRIVDYIVGEDASYQDAKDTIASVFPNSAPKGLEDIAKDPSLRFTTLDESPLQYDLNGSGNMTDSIRVAVYLKNGHAEARFQISPDGAFGDPVTDFAYAVQNKLPTTIDLYTGSYYHRVEEDPSPSAVAVKFKTPQNKPINKQIQIAFVGIAPGAQHGISNLQMAGGDFSLPDGIRYHGVATGAKFIVAQPWLNAQQDYGNTWLSLARTIASAAEAGADVLDLDLGAPGSRPGNDLLSNLLCRVTERTNTVPVIAVHNYGPLPDTIQNFAESPCALGIGASQSIASLKYGNGKGTIDPSFKADDEVQTASYSSRGFAINGEFKPDIISPAYAYTAYGPHFIRFGGTSGATPTTAGMIALLKQAARVRGAELNFEQIKFLLQASSRPVSPEHIRDGYGYSDLAAAWAFFERHFHHGSPDILPFRLSGLARVAFDGRPTEQSFPLTLKRETLLGSDNTPEHMDFWIEYGGADAGKTAHWLKFYNTVTGTTVESMKWDAPMGGESQALSLMITLSDAEWDALPEGDHVAVVKGVRSLFKGDRAVDFLMPVSFTKPNTFDETTYPIHPLYADQYQIFNIRTLPGERLLLEGHPSCDGKPIELAVDGSNGAAPFLMIDNEKDYLDGSSIMNSYAALNMDPGPISVDAKKDTVRIAVVRYRSTKCEGPIGGSLLVRRMGFDLRASSTGFTGLKADFGVDLKLQAEPLDEADFDRNLNWSLLAGLTDSEKPTSPAVIVVRKITDSASSFTLPAGIRSVTVTAKDDSHFAAVLTSQNPDGKISETLTPQGSFNAGLSQYKMMQLQSPVAGQLISYMPDSSGGLAATQVIIELEAALPDSVQIAMDAVKPIALWQKDQTKSMNFHVTLPSGLPSDFHGFPTSEWSYALRLPISIHEAAPNSTSSALYVDQAIWTGKAELALPFSP